MQYLHFKKWWKIEPDQSSRGTTGHHEGNRQPLFLSFCKPRPVVWKKNKCIVFCSIERETLSGSFKVTNSLESGWVIQCWILERLSVRRADKLSTGIDREVRRSIILAVKRRLRGKWCLEFLLDHRRKIRYQGTFIAKELWPIV